MLYCSIFGGDEANQVAFIIRHDIDDEILIVDQNRRPIGIKLFKQIFILHIGKNLFF
ncbi:hypothetical protein PAAL109150_21905 [Paenibacillus alkaliterrae]